MTDACGVGHIGRRVELGPAERRLAEYLAKARHAANRRSGVRDARVGPQSSAETDLEGIAAELAFCKLFNAYPDLGEDARPPFDARLPLDGVYLRVDVKATRYRSGRLLAVPGKATKAERPDAYALVVGAFPGPYEFRGFLAADELLRPTRLTDLGHGPTYSAAQAELVELSKLAIVRQGR
jgi:hypothetical protein